MSVSAHETKLDELRAVCAEVRTLLDEGVPPRGIGIVARSLDDDDVRLLSRFAAELGFATTATTATPLLAHRLGRGLATILRLRDRGFPRGDVFELLRDGFTPRRRIEARRRGHGHAAGARRRRHRERAAERRPQADARGLRRGGRGARSRSRRRRRCAAASGARRWRRWPRASGSKRICDVEAAAAIDEVCALFRRWPSNAFRFESGH